MIEQLGWLDTNIFIHVLMQNVTERPRCEALLASLRSGLAEAYIDITVVHELTYVLLRLQQFQSREHVRTYIDAILGVQAIRAEDKDRMRAALSRWTVSPAGFVDVSLRSQAESTGLPVCSANVKDFPDIQNSFLNANV